MAFLDPNHRITRRYRGASSIVFDMDETPEQAQRRQVRPSKRLKNADFAASIEQQGFPENTRPAEYGIGSGGRRVRKLVECPAGQSQIGGGGRCDVVGFNGEYTDEYDYETRWEGINNDFLGEHRSPMAVHRPKYREAEGVHSPPAPPPGVLHRARSPGTSFRGGAVPSALKDHVVFGKHGMTAAGDDADSGTYGDRLSRKMVPNAPASNSYRVLQVELQEAPAPFRSSLRCGIAPKPELERTDAELPREKRRDLFNMRR